jgi:hypothetical protein
MPSSFSDISISENDISENNSKEKNTKENNYELFEITRKKYDDNKLSRYFLKHKGKVLIIIICFIIICIAIFVGEAQIDGSINTTNTKTKMASIIGFIFTNLFMVMLITISGIETYFSREEYKILEKDLNKTLDSKIKEQINNPVLKDIIHKFKNKIKSKDKYTTKPNKIAISNQIGSNDESYQNNKELSQIEIDKLIELLSFDEKNKFYEELKNL